MYRLNDKVSEIPRCSLAEKRHIPDSEEERDRVEAVEVCFVSGDPSIVSRS